MKPLLTFLSLLLSLSSFGQSLYGDLEAWRSVPVSSAPSAGIQDPVQWYSPDSVIYMAKYLYPQANFKRQLFRSADAHGGNYSAQLITRNQDSLGMLPALLTNTQISVDLANPNPEQSLVFSGGTVINQQIPSVTAWIKYFPNGVDTGSILVKAVKTTSGQPDTILAANTILITPTSNWVKIAVPLIYMDQRIPNHLRIWISSGSQCIARDSTVLYVDDIQLTPLDVAKVQTTNDFFTLYPNPSSGCLNVKTTSPAATLTIIDLSGKLKESRMINKTATLDLLDYPSGIYFAKLTDENGDAQTLTFTVTNH